MSVRRPRKPLRAAAYQLPGLGALAHDLSSFTVHDALRDGFDALLAAAPELRLLANIDADLRLRLTTTRLLFERERASGPVIVTGFHAPRHLVTSIHDDFVAKASLGGANLLFDVDTYRTLVRPSLSLHWDWQVAAKARTQGVRLLCTRPSVVQHNRVTGRFSRSGAVDRAPDFTARGPQPRTRVEHYRRAVRRAPPSGPRRLAICVATARRPLQLGRLLDALAVIDLPPACNVEVRVVDNDPLGSAAGAVAAFASIVGERLAVRYAVERRPGVSDVRNRALDFGPADLVAFIDDDEWPEPTWLTDLVRALDGSQDDAAFGPVVAAYGDDGAAWRGRRAHGAPCPTSGRVPWTVGRTGNALIVGAWFYERVFRFDA